MAKAETLKTMQPNPAWDVASYPDVVDTPTAAGCTFKVWDGDWCDDCHGQLLDFTTTFDAAGIPAERIDHCPAEKANDGSEVDPFVEEYDIGLIPTVVVERDGKEVTRFVEEEDIPIAVYLTDELSNWVPTPIL